MSEPTIDRTDAVRERARNFRDLFGGSKLGTYQGIPIFAAPGLHELAAETLLRAVPPSPAVDVLELGAGGGAMSQRLADLGYAVTASDLFIERFEPREHVAFHTLDLNQAFSRDIARRFDVVVALELIEHLESPYHFMRQCFELLEPGGRMLVSTPNLANPVSQAMFVRSGMFQWFRDEDHVEQGHIMPVAPVVLRRCWQDAGFELVRDDSVSNPYRRVKSLRRTGTRWLARLLSLVSGTPRRLRGEVYLALLRKPAA